MRIGFVGSHGTGKSTLVKALSQIMPDYMLGKEFSREVVKNCGINFETTDATQHSFHQYYLQMMKEKQPENFLTSRTLVDLYAYTCYFYRHNKGVYKIHENTLSGVMHSLMDYRKFWDLYVYLPIEFDLEEENEFRVGQKENPDYRFEVDLWARRTLTVCQLPFIEVTGTVENRVSQVLEAMKNEPENNLL